jgi:hypothetical protein
MKQKGREWVVNITNDTAIAFRSIAVQGCHEAWFENGAQGRNRTRIGGIPLISETTFTQSEVLSEIH